MAKNHRNSHSEEVPEKEVMGSMLVIAQGKM